MPYYNCECGQHKYSFRSCVIKIVSERKEETNLLYMYIILCKDKNITKHHHNVVTYYIKN